MQKPNFERDSGPIWIFIVGLIGAYLAFGNQSLPENIRRVDMMGYGLVDAGNGVMVLAAISFVANRFSAAQRRRAERKGAEARRDVIQRRRATGDGIDYGVSRGKKRS